MNYEVLTRKWRPQSFSDLIGQNIPITALINTLKSQKIHHAYLFSGTHGIGKTTIARLFAKGMNCEVNITAEPCGQCIPCQEIMNGNFIDVIEIDAASRTKVEEIRELIDNVQYVPVKGRYKVYVIDEIHMLSRHSFNALLKTLEEPPNYVKFLLATTDLDKIPMTILSRCLHFHLRTLDENVISLRLKYILEKEKVLFDLDALELISKIANGSMRDALTIAEQAIILGNDKISVKLINTMLGTLNESQILELLEGIIYINSNQVIKLLNQFAMISTIDWEVLLIDLLKLLYYIARLQCLPEEQFKQNIQLKNEILQRLKKLALTISSKNVQNYYHIIIQGRKELSMAPTKKIGVEMTILRALAFNYKNPLIQSPINTDLNNYLEAQDDANEPILLKNQNLHNKNLTNQLISAKNQLICKTKEINKPLLTTPSKNATLKKNTFLKYEDISSFITDKVPNNIKNTNYQFFFSKLKKKLLQNTWIAEIFKLSLSSLAQELALNCCKEQKECKIRLYFRSNKQYLNTVSSQKILSEALMNFLGKKLEISFVENNDPKIKTPLELINNFYEEQLDIARQSIFSDPSLDILCRFFHANIDEQSIVLV
ncbi:MAG: DNA polymerase III subunit gamma/tau [Candidatus Dasytiphilus stammeri]